MMPHMDGWAVLTALKADPEVADIPVIMETIVREKGLALSLGAADFLTKPIQWPRLKKVLERYRSAQPPLSVLVVDDDDSTRPLAELLEGEGWSVRQASDPEAVFTRLSESRPALVLVDLNMTETNGFTLIREMRRKADWRDLPVVALTHQELTPEQSARLEGRVQQIINTEDETPEALLSVLRRIPSSRAARPAAAPEKKHGYDIVG
jgi:CheY-like chemotaxis protein